MWVRGGGEDGGRVSVGRKNRSGIPTEYNGVRFRSRLEARWAAMFDLFDWQWEYEPLDLEGYIPDFLLKFHVPLLVEVKPWLPHEDPSPVQGVLDAQPWDGEIWLAGAQLGDFATDTACGRIRDAECGWDDAVLRLCLDCSAPSLQSSNFAWRCRRCDSSAESCGWGAFDITRANRLWRAAGNAVQWQPHNREAAE